MRAKSVNGGLNSILKPKSQKEVFDSYKLMNKQQKESLLFNNIMRLAIGSYEIFFDLIENKLGEEKSFETWIRTIYSLEYNLNTRLKVKLKLKNQSNDKIIELLKNEESGISINLVVACFLNSIDNQDLDFLLGQFIPGINKIK